MIAFLSHQMRMQNIRTKEPIENSFGERLKTARKHLSITQEELASKAGLSTITISKLESGVNKPSFDVIIALSHSMDIEPNYFFGWSNEISAKSSSARRIKLQSLILQAEYLDDIWLDQLIALSKLAYK